MGTGVGVGVGVRVGMGMGMEGGTYEDAELAYAPSDEEECEPHGRDAPSCAVFLLSKFRFRGSRVQGRER